LTRESSGIPVEAPQDIEEFLINDNLLIPPEDNPEGIKVIKGPNIKEVPVRKGIEEEVSATVLLKLGDNITTDDIMPAGSKILPLRSNIPAISEYVFHNIDPTFSRKALELKERGGVVIIGGDNYGQGSSREHAAIAPMYLGVRAVIAKSFARIHRANLINFGILPLIFKNPEDYERISQGDSLRITGIKKALLDGAGEIAVENITKKNSFSVRLEFNERERRLLLSGGLLPYLKEKA
jgi:aconitate hydratase